MELANYREATSNILDKYKELIANMFANYREIFSNILDQYKELMAKLQNHARSFYYLNGDF